MRDPFTHPFCEESDLGLALPESDHAVSVCLPRWDHVVGYEEGDESIIEAFESGYPRFVPHPWVAELFVAAQEEFAKQGESALVFPSLAAAWRAAEYVKRRSGASCRLESYAWDQLTVLLLPESAFEAGWKYWQHSGEIVSSRLAESALTDSPLDEEIALAGGESLATIRKRIAELYTGARPGDVFLFSSGMAAVAAVHRILAEDTPEPTLQVEFPYLDSFKVQEQFGAGVADFSCTSSGGVEEIETWFAQDREASAVFTEIPSNPLLRTADLAGISSLLEDREIPLVVDDTVASAVLVDSFRFVDVVTTSLTKTFSGVGDVAAGAVVLKSGCAREALLRERLPDAEAASPLFARDAIALERNSRHFVERVRASSEIAEAVLPAIRDRPEVRNLWHPSTECREFYDQVRREGEGYGGLFSLELEGGEAAGRAFYDALRISKGPSLGTDFSLACPYTLLAHYGELAWAEERGAGRNLIRVWIGLEDPEDLEERFAEAFAAVGNVVG